ncbi:MAG: CinA family protein [Clostridiales bacterium]|jgi:nicotinamide-nucleotide amidase|nr:CinA family protein [Clostridiales bacterium]
MNVSILIIDAPDRVFERDNAAAKICRMLSLKGYDVRRVMSIPSDDAGVRAAVEYLKADAAAVLIYGDSDAFRNAYSADYIIDKAAGILEFDGTLYGFTEGFDKEFIRDKFIPALNGKCKTFYNTAVFKTFGKTGDELRALLTAQIKNKNRIAFKFIEGVGECEARVRYSSKTSKPDADAVIAAVAAALGDVTYSTTDSTLAEEVADCLKVHKKTVCVAESFTGGAVTAELVKIPGISAALVEGVTAYSNGSKIARLNVEPQIIERYGAVAIETAYEMAANILLANGCDYSVATTGNAGPSAEKPGEEGVCFIAVGNVNGIHIYKYRFSGGRAEVIECGVKAALFRLLKRLKKSGFDELKEIHELGADK